MIFQRVRLMLPVILALAAANLFSQPKDGPTGAGKPEPSQAVFPEDLGPEKINISQYPPQYRKTYYEVFLKVYGFLGTQARVINSPLVEMDPQLEETERRLHPALFADPLIAIPTRNGWKREVEKIRRRPPCCGACPVLSRQDAMRLWEFLVYDSIIRKTGPHASGWIRHRQKLLRQFEKTHPDRIANKEEERSI